MGFVLAGVETLHSSADLVHGFLGEGVASPLGGGLGELGCECVVHGLMVAARHHWRTMSGPTVCQPLIGRPRDHCVMTQ